MYALKSKSTSTAPKYTTMTTTSSTRDHTVERRPVMNAVTITMPKRISRLSQVGA